MKKKWKKIVCLLLVCLLVIVGVGAYFLHKPKNALPGETAKTVEVQVGIGEEAEYVQLLTVRGNEISYGTGITEFIPVGTKVTTKLGTVTTFSRLRAGDNVALVRDKGTGEITSVYIVD